MTPKKPDAAARLAAKYPDGPSAARIRRLIAREVKKERERCVNIVKRHVSESPWTDAEIVARHIVRGIMKGPK